MVLVAVQLSVLGLYFPPVLKTLLALYPPHTIISVPVHTAVCWARASGALVLVVGVQVSVPGLYRPPVFKALPLVPPHTIISLLVQTAV